MKISIQLGTTDNPMLMTYVKSIGFL